MHGTDVFFKKKITQLVRGSTQLWTQIACANNWNLAYTHFIIYLLFYYFILFIYYFIHFTFIHYFIHYAFIHYFIHYYFIHFIIYSNTHILFTYLPQVKNLISRMQLSGYFLQSACTERSLLQPPCLCS